MRRQHLGSRIAGCCVAPAKIPCLARQHEHVAYLSSLQFSPLQFPSLQSFSSSFLPFAFLLFSLLSFSNFALRYSIPITAKAYRCEVRSRGSNTRSMLIGSCKSFEEMQDDRKDAGQKLRRVRAPVLVRGCICVLERRRRCAKSSKMDTFSRMRSAMAHLLPRKLLSVRNAELVFRQSVPHIGWQQ